jgi:hypothetical protein
MDQIETLINVCMVDIKNALPDLDDVAGQAAEAAGEAGGAFIGWGRAEANKAEAFGLPKAGSEQEFASQPGWGVETRQEGCDKKGFQSGGF